MEYATVTILSVLGIDATIMITRNMYQALLGAIIRLYMVSDLKNQDIRS
jgi:hypothetical protein